MLYRIEWFQFLTPPHMDENESRWEPRVSDSGALCSILVHRRWPYPLGVGHIVIQVPRLTRRPARAPAEVSMPISFSSPAQIHADSRYRIHTHCSSPQRG